MLSRDNITERTPDLKPIKRRSFLKATLATTAFGAAPFSILPAGPSPNSKLNIACIGVGGQGSGDASYLARADNVIALCDPDEARHKKCIAGKKNLHAVKLWKDYRVMFDKIGKEIDAVYTGSPEHAHFAISMYAIRRGKHIYTQKPLCHTVNEVRVLTEEAKKSKVITQMGHQGHSTRSSALIRDWVQAGAVGDIKEVWAYSRKNYWTRVDPVKGSEIPATLDWNLYLNRAREIPFSTSYMGREWIRFSHFSGVVGDMGAHILDPAYYSLDIRTPTSVIAEVKDPPKAGWLPMAGVITWEFPARGKMPPVTVKYHLGPEIEYPRPKHLEEGRKAHFMNSGSVLIGENASVMAGSHSQGGRIFPEVAMKETKTPPEVAHRCKAGDHRQNWTLACKGEDKIMSPFEYAGPLSEVIILGDIAMMHPGEKLLWDSKNMKITNNVAADKDMFMRRLAPRDNMNWI
jgi:predicted dehydrogenase